MALSDPFGARFVDGEDEWVDHEDRPWHAQWPTDRALEAHVRDMREGLPVDEKAVAEVMASVRNSPGPRDVTYLRAVERADALPSDLLERYGEIAAHYRDLDGGSETIWHADRWVLRVYAVGAQSPFDELAARFPDRVEIAHAAQSRHAAAATVQRWIEDLEHGRTPSGLDFISFGDAPGGQIQISFATPDRPEHEAWLQQRYGPGLDLEWIGPDPWHRSRRPFGSWAAQERTLRIFYSRDRNGERHDSCDICETDDEVIVTVLVAGPWITELRGGTTPTICEITLQRPVGQRRVVDGTDGQPRPSRDAYHLPSDPEAVVEPDNG